MLGPDKKAIKGTIQKIGKNAKGKSIPTVKWNNGSTSEVTFGQIMKDEYPAEPNPVFSKPKKDSGPAPMDLGATGKGKKPVVCDTCSSRGHFASQCPSKPYSGQGADISDAEEENEDLQAIVGALSQREIEI